MPRPRSALPHAPTQMSEDSEGQPIIKNLFTEFSLSALPDKVNKPTEARLARFLRDELKLNLDPKPLTVRELVAEMFKFNAADTLAWEVYRGHTKGHSGKSSVSLEDAANMQVEVQRVFARCAANVARVLDDTLSEHRADNRRTKDAKATLSRRAKSVRMQVRLPVYVFVY